MINYPTHVEKGIIVIDFPRPVSRKEQQTIRNAVFEQYGHKIGCALFFDEMYPEHKIGIIFYIITIIIFPPMILIIPFSIKKQKKMQLERENAIKQYNVKL